MTDSVSMVLPAGWFSWKHADRRAGGENRGSAHKRYKHSRAEAGTCMMAVELGGVKAGGLSLTSERSIFKVTVEDMAGEPLSNACTEREYLDT